MYTALEYRERKYLKGETEYDDAEHTRLSCHVGSGGMEQNGDSRIEGTKPS